MMLVHHRRPGVRPEPPRACGCRVLVPLRPESTGLGTREGPQGTPGLSAGA